MRFVVLLRADRTWESGSGPAPAVRAVMGKYTEDLVKAGVLLAAEGLEPSARGARVRFDGDAQAVVDGPFPESGEAIAGFWLIDVKSKEEAIEWVKRCPLPRAGQVEIEIRQVFEASDFGGAQTTPSNA
jgi:hypothetical protein